MKGKRLLFVTDQWFGLLLRFYPVDFRDEMGKALLETYRDRARETYGRGGFFRLAGLWFTAFLDFMFNGLGERKYPAVRWRRNGEWGRDLELAGRRLRQRPLFLFAVVGTLTVGLGAFAVVYAAVDKILIEPMPYSQPNDLYFVWRDYRAYFDLARGWLSGPDIAELQKAGGAIESVAGMQMTGPTLSISPDAPPLQIKLMLISPNLFQLLGVSPSMGRSFDTSEVGANRPSVVILGDGLWKRLGGSPAILGSKVWLSGTPYTVIGVMPPTFRFVMHSSLGPPQAADLYIPFRFNLADQSPNNGSFAALIRARRGSSPETVAAAVSAVGRFVDQRDNKSRGLRLYPVGLQSDLVAPVRRVLFGLGLAGILLLLVLTLNLASLLLARAAEREKEFAVSRAIGANGIAVVRSMLFEGGLLGFLGGVTGALAAVWGARALVVLAPLDLPRREAMAVDWRVASVVIAVGLLLGLLAASAPAGWASRVSLASLMAASSVRGAGAPGRMRRGILIVQVGLSLALLSAAGLVVRSFERLLHSDPGFRSEGVLTFSIAMGPRLFPKSDDVLLFQDRVETALRALPGVTRVGATSALPLGASAAQTDVGFPGAPGNTGDNTRDYPLVDYIVVRPGYLAAMGMRLLIGRDFDEARHEEMPEALIDQHLAKQFFPTGNPIGATIRFQNKSLRIIGVVDQARVYDLHQDGRPQILVRSDNGNPYTPYFVLDTDKDPEALIPEVRSLIRQIDPRIPVSSEHTMNEIVTDALRRQRVSTVLVAGFAVGALLLVVMGLFGVISGSIARRRGEIAVRLALGATHQRVIRLVVAEGAWLIGLGIVVGLPAVYVSGKAIRGLLIGVSPFDAATLAGVGAGLVALTMLVCYLAARRVVAIEPSRLLRE